MRDLRPTSAREWTATSRRSTAAGSRRSRARRLPHARVLRRRSRQRVLAARRRRLVRGAPRRRRRHPLDGPCDARRRGGGARDGSRARHRSWMRAHGTTTFEGKSGYGLDHDTELAQLRAVRAAGGSPDLARRAHGAAGVRRRRRVPRLPPRGGAARGSPARGGGRCLPRARLVRRPTRLAAISRRAATPGSRCACTATSSPSRARSGSRSSSARDRSTTSRRPARPASRELAASDVTGVLLPASALFLGRPMPPGRALVDAGALVALATDFNPGSAFCDSLPLVLSLACTQMKLAPEEALVAATVNAAHVLGRADRIGRLAARLRRRHRAARRARLAPRRLPPGRRHRPHGRRRRSGRVPAHGIIPVNGDPEAAQATRQGEAARLRPRLHRRGRGRAARRAARRPAQAHGPWRQGVECRRARRRSSRSRSGRGGRTAQPPSWRKVLKRGAIFAPIFLATVMLLGGNKMTFTGARSSRRSC